MNNLQILFHSYNMLYFYLTLADMTFSLWGSQEKSTCFIVLQIIQQIKTFKNVLLLSFWAWIGSHSRAEWLNYYQRIHAVFQKISQQRSSEYLIGKKKGILISNYIIHKISSWWTTILNMKGETIRLQRKTKHLCNHRVFEHLYPLKQT